MCLLMGIKPLFYLIYGISTNVKVQYFSLSYDIFTVIVICEAARYLLFVSHGLATSERSVSVPPHSEAPFFV